MITIRQVSSKKQVQIFGFNDPGTETVVNNQAIEDTKNISTSTVAMKELRNIDVLSVSEFAREASVTPQAVRKMINENRITAFKIGEQYVIGKNELFKYLNDR